MAKGGTIEYGIKFNVDKSSLSTIRTEINRMSHEIKEMAKDPNTFVDKNTIANVEKLQSALNKSWNIKLNQLNLNKFQSELEKSKISMTQLKDTFLQIGQFGTFNNLTSNLLTANAQLKVTNNFVERIATSFGNVARYALSSKIFNNFTNSISKAYQYTINLDSSLNKIRIVSGQSADQMDRFAVNANKAAKALGTSTLEYTKGALIYYQQGLSAEEANKRTEVTLKMANVLGASAQEVSNYMTAIWNNFDNGTETLEHYADVITALGAATASSSEEIATGLEKFAAIAKTIGLSYEYATTALATVVAQTRQSADSVGTAFKTIFARMEDLKLGKTLDDGTTLGKYSSTLAKIGVSIKDQNGQLRNMDDILSDMGTKWSTLSKDQQVAVAQGVAGIRQYTQLMALLDNWDKFTQNLTVAQGAAGTLQKQQDTYMQSFEAHLQKLKTEAERTYDILFDSDSAKDFIDILVAGFTKVNDVLANMGGGLNTVVNLLSQAGMIFSKQIGTEAVRVWNNAKTSFMGQKRKEAFVDEVINAYQKPNQEILETTYGENDLTKNAVKKQAENIKQILKVSSGLTTETQEQIIKEQQKIAILDVEIQKREELLQKAKEAKILTSEQADKMKQQAAEEGKIDNVEKFGKYSIALKEKEKGIDLQQRQEREELNQNREDAIRQAKQNQEIAANTRKVFAAIQGINALTTAIKTLSNESITVQEKVSGIAQSIISGFGAAISAVNPLVGILFQIGGSLLVPIITDLIDFRSEIEKLQSKVKETQETFEKASNAYQELKGTLSNYDSAKKGLEGLEQGTVEFYEAVIKANEQAQKLIDKLNLIAGKDYSIDLNTGVIRFNEESLSDAMFNEQQKVMRAQLTNIQAQYDLKAAQRENIIEAGAATTNRNGMQLSIDTMRSILNREISKNELTAEDQQGNLYKTSKGKFEITNNWDFITNGLDKIENGTQDITKEVADYRGQYDKVSAEMLALQKQIAYNTIQAYGSKEQVEAYKNATQSEKENIAKEIINVDEEDIKKRKENVEDFYTYWSFRTANQTEKNREVAQRLGFSEQDLNQIEGFTKGTKSHEAFKTEQSYWKTLYAYSQGYRYNSENESWTRPGGMPVADAEEEIFGVDKNIAKNYLLNVMPQMQKMNDTFDVLSNLTQKVSDYYSGQTVNKEVSNYTREAVFAAQTKDETYNYGALNQQEAIAVQSILDTQGLELEGNQLQQLQEAINGLQNTIARAKKDLDEYNAVIDQNASALGTSSQALKVYDAALQNADKKIVNYNKTLAEAAAASYKFNKTYNEGRKTFSDNKDAWEIYIKSLKNGKKISYDVADGAGEILKQLKQMGLELNNEQLKDPKTLKIIQKMFTGTAKEAEKAYNSLSKMVAVDELITKFGIAQTAAENFFETMISGTYAFGTDITNQVQSLLGSANDVKMSLEDWKAWAEKFGIQIEVTKEPDTKVSEFKTPGTKKTTKHTIEGHPIFDNLGNQIGTSDRYTYTETVEDEGQTLYGVGNLSFTSTGTGGSFGSGKNFTPSSSKSKSGSSSKPKQIDSLKDEADRYHKVNTQITKIDNSLKKLQSQQDKYLGTKLIENLNKQWTLLNTQITNYTEKLKIANGEQAELAEKLSKKGVQFNPDGTISNYMEAFNAQEQYVNKLIAQYNKLSKKQQETWDNNKVIDKAKEDFNKFKENMNRYDELISDFIPQLQQSIQDGIDKQIELNIKKFNLEIKVTLDLNQATRDWNAWVKRAIQGFSDKDIFGKSQARLKDFNTYFNENGSGDIQGSSKHVNEILQELYRMDRGEENIYGDNRAKGIEELKDKYTELMGKITDVIELQDELHQNWLDKMDEVQEKFSEQINNYDFLREILNHDLKIIQLSMGSDAYAEMAQFYEQQQDNYEKQLDFQRQQKDFWYAQMQAAEKGTEEWEKAKEKWKNAVKEFNTILQEGLQNAIDKFKNAINNIFKNLNNSITGGLGLDYINTQWDLINKNANRYLDTINTTYAIRQLEKKYADAINKTNNIAQQQKLKKVMDQQVAAIKEKEKLTQYDIDRANKLYEIELARNALEEARDNKSQMRLRRDSQGNYSYQYIANLDAIKQAEDNLDNLYNSLYNFDKDRYNSTLNDIYISWNEYQQKMTEAALINDPELRAEKERLIQQEYNELLIELEDEYQISKYNLQESFFNDWVQLNNMELEQFKSLNDNEKNIILTEMIPTWESGLAQMAEAFSGSDGFAKVTIQSWEEIKASQKEYLNNTQNLEKASNQTFSVIVQGEDDAINKSKELIEDNQIIIDKYGEELDAVKLCYDEVNKLIDAHKQEMEAAKIAAEEAYNYYKIEIDAQQKAYEVSEKLRTSQTAVAEAMAKAQATVQTTNTSNSTSSGSGGNNSGGSSGSSSSSSSSKTTSTKTTTAKKTYTVTYSSDGKSSFKQVSVKDGDKHQVNGNPPSKTNYKFNGYFSSSAGGKYKNGEYITVKQNITLTAQWEQIASSKSTISAVASAATGAVTGALTNSSSSSSTNWNILSKLGLKTYDTGGYTGSWDSTGRLAMLHQKELVLNQSDTKNMLDAVSIMRGLTYSLGSTVLSKLAGAIATGYSGSDSQNNLLEQNVHIDATFPNVKNASEIEQALNNLVNVASQRIMEKR